MRCARCWAAGTRRCFARKCRPPPPTSTRRSSAPSTRRASRQKVARLQHNGIRIVCAVLLIVGLIAWMSGHANEGIGFASGGIALFLLIEIRRLVWRFIAALFDPNAR